jgi:hypothetical protein
MHIDEWIADAKVFAEEINQLSTMKQTNEPA